jgi:hypothetical protein
MIETVTTSRLDRPRPLPAPTVRGRTWLSVSGPAAISIGLTLLFFAITVWWLTQDRRVPMADNALHTLIGFSAYDNLRSGALLGPFQVWTVYPPLVHVVGGLGVFFGGRTFWAGVIAQNLVFLPLLVLGVYQTGRLVFEDARAGLLAVVFALGTPMVIGQFHITMIDPPEAALAAVSVWLLLSTRGFEDVDRAALAGLAVGLGMLTKETFPAFIGGLLLVMLLRGGWRNWRGLGAFALVAAAVGGPWYIAHMSDLRAHYAAAGIVGGQPLPSEVTTASALWYVWTAINFQMLFPLVVFGAVGIVLALVHVAKKRSERPLVVELLAGAFVSWLAVTLALPPTARYTLPALVYFAVLGAGWIVLLPRPGRLVATTLLVLVATINMLGASVGVGHRIMISLPGATPKVSATYQGGISLFTDDGYGYGGPERSGDLAGLMDRLGRRGITTVRWVSTATPAVAFDSGGLEIFARTAGLKIDKTPDAALPVPVTEATLIQQPAASVRKPCRRLYDGTVVTVELGTLDEGKRVNGCPPS